jgi:GntR family transcriptional regulator, transcriptional repressor for pyruvate dehydrogenase complex
VPPSSPLDKARLGSLLARRLAQDISQGLLPPDTKLPSETTLSRQFNSSRASIREALQILKARGLVISRQGSGNYVAGDFSKALSQSLEQYATLLSDSTTFLELLDLRLLLEIHCVREMAQSTSTKALHHLEETLKKMEQKKSDLRSFGRHDIRFHLALAQGSKHALFRQILEALLPTLGMRYAKETYTNRKEAEKTLREHRDIFHAIRDGDSPRAAAALKNHLVQSREHLQALLSKS